jgi:hypothetical protein
MLMLLVLLAMQQALSKGLSCCPLASYCAVLCCVVLCCAVHWQVDELDVDTREHLVRELAAMDAGEPMNSAKQLALSDAHVECVSGAVRIVMDDSHLLSPPTSQLPF